MMRIALVGVLAAAVQAEQVSPIGKVLELMSDLQAKVLKEGEGAQKVYSEFAEWCEEQSKQLTFEIKTGKAEVADLKATIEQETAKIGCLETRLEELSGSVATDEADLKAATEIREKENSAFVAEEKELAETVDTLQRAIGIIEREMKGGASMLQLHRADGVVQTLSLLVEASELSTADAGQITAFLQSRARGEDAEPGAPAAAVYESQSGNIVETLTGLLEEAEEQLSALRRKETKDLHAYEMVKQSLEDELKYANNEIDEAKAGIASAEEKKSKAEGDLTVTSKGLAEDIQAIGELHHECMTKAEDFEAETKSRGEELAAIAKAKEVIKESVGSTEKLSYGLDQVSLLQLGSTAASRAAHMVRDLARAQHSTMLAQLAARMRAVSGADQFAKIKAWQALYNNDSYLPTRCDDLRGRARRPGRLCVLPNIIDERSRTDENQKSRRVVMISALWVRWLGYDPGKKGWQNQQMRIGEATNPGPPRQNKDLQELAKAKKRLMECFRPAMDKAGEALNILGDRNPKRLQQIVAGGGDNDVMAKQIFSWANEEDPPIPLSSVRAKTLAKKSKGGKPEARIKEETVDIDPEEWSDDKAQVLDQPEDGKVGIVWAMDDLDVQAWVQQYAAHPMDKPQVIVYEGHTMVPGGEMCQIPFVKGRKKYREAARIWQIGQGSLRPTEVMKVEIQDVLDSVAVLAMEISEKHTPTKYREIAEVHHIKGIRAVEMRSMMTHWANKSLSNKVQESWSMAHYGRGDGEHSYSLLLRVPAAVADEALNNSGRGGVFYRRAHLGDKEAIDKERKVLELIPMPAETTLQQALDMAKKHGEASRGVAHNAGKLSIRATITKAGPLRKELLGTDMPRGTEVWYVEGVPVNILPQQLESILRDKLGWQVQAIGRPYFKEGQKTQKVTASGPPQARLIQVTGGQVMRLQRAGDRPRTPPPLRSGRTTTAPRPSRPQSVTPRATAGDGRRAAMAQPVPGDVDEESTRHTGTDVSDVVMGHTLEETNELTRQVQALMQRMELQDVRMQALEEKQEEQATQAKEQGAGIERIEAQQTTMLELLQSLTKGTVSRAPTPQEKRPSDHKGEEPPVKQGVGAVGGAKTSQ